MTTDRLQAQRFELKYIIREDVAEAISDFVRSYLELDEFGEGKPDLSYPVHSLYLDSDQLALYWHTLNGTKNRFKLRVRYYSEAPDAPAFFEIKRRMNNCIMKQRGGVRREAVPLLLKGQLPEPEHLVADSPKYMVAVQRFCFLLAYINARPMTHVGYQREAWISRGDNSVRVTLDRHVGSEPDFLGKMETDMRTPVYPFGDNVILELKFTDRHPTWFREMVRVFGLMQCGAAKYAEGVNAIGEEKLRRKFKVVSEPDKTMSADELNPDMAFSKADNRINEVEFMYD
ncbi:MAG: polyphosphate polymerase domain-containing protein [Verrucomicrobia bacterium]|nr:polyphosphate polymerase domain-containing protein [Verrucomicrobiota bacterium]